LVSHHSTEQLFPYSAAYFGDSEENQFVLFDHDRSRLQYLLIIDIIRWFHSDIVKILLGILVALFGKDAVWFNAVEIEAHAIQRGRDIVGFIKQALLGMNALRIVQKPSVEGRADGRQYRDQTHQRDCFHYLQYWHRHNTR
jgi:hypothetical protein